MIIIHYEREEIHIFKYVKLEVLTTNKRQFYLSTSIVIGQINLVHLVGPG